MLKICFKAQRCCSALEAVGQLPSSSQVGLTSFVPLLPFNCNVFASLKLSFLELTPFSNVSGRSRWLFVSSRIQMKFRCLNVRLKFRLWPEPKRQCFSFTAPPLTSPHLSLICSVISQECGLVNKQFWFFGSLF